MRLALGWCCCVVIAMNMAAPAAIAAPEVGWMGCGMGEDKGECSGAVTDATDDFGSDADTAVPIVDNSAQQTEMTNLLLATVYEQAGFPRCPFEGMRRDDEIDLAIGDIVRHCNEEADPEDEEAPPTWDEIVAIIRQEFFSLLIAPSPITAQPDGDWALINMDFIVYTDPAPQAFERELLGMDITFLATPVHYSWDFGDGSPPLLTSSPGNPYPNQDVAHVYTSSADAVAVSVTTTWQGTFQINGSGAWLPVSGFATTTATAPPVEIVAMDVHLVPNR